MHRRTPLHRNSDTPPKERECICGATFTPRRMEHIVCSPRCLVRHKAAKAKAERESLKARKEAIKTIAQLIAEAQREFNAYTRERDKDKGCFVCGRPFEDKPGRVQHAGHVRSRGAAGHLRFHEDNCLGECEGCNGPHGAKPHQIKAGAIARIGQERFDALEADNTPHKWTREELIAIKNTYRAKRKELENKEC